MAEFWSCIRLATWEVRDDVPEEIYDAERAALGEQFDAEYGASFLGSGSALLSEADIRACIRPGGDLDPTEGDGWVVGADLAWRRDPSAAVVVGRPNRDQGELVAAAVRQWPAPPPEELERGHERHQEMVIREIAALAKQWGASVYTDTLEASTVKARFARHGVICHTLSMAEVKSDIYRELGRHVRSGTISFPEDPVLIGELRRLRVRYGGRRPTIENPRAAGTHGDVAQALAVGVGMFASDVEEEAAAAGAGTDMVAGLFPADPMIPLGGSWYGA